MNRSLGELERVLLDYAKWTQEAHDSPEFSRLDISIQDMDVDMLRQASEVVAMYRGLCK